MKIRNKIALLFTILVASILILFSFLIFKLAQQDRQNEFKFRLDYRGKTLTNLLINVDEIDEALINLIHDNSFSSLFEEHIELYDLKGKIVYVSKHHSSHTPEEVVDRFLTGEMSYYRQGDREIHGSFFQTKRGKLLIITSAIDKQGLDRIHRLQLMLTAGILGATVFIGLAGWLFAKKILRPISDIIVHVSEITGQDLSMRLQTGKSEDELSKLADTFNQLLERLEISIRNQQSFIANASHELRTPLSIMLARIEMELQNNSNSPDVFRLLHAELNEVIHLANGLLEISQVDSINNTTSFKGLRMDEMIYEAIAACKKKYPGQIIDLVIDEVEEEQELNLLGSDTLLQRCFINLLDNACKYSSHQRVAVSIEHFPFSLQVVISDFGIGIPEAELQAITDPFYRASNAVNFPGNGLGLSLVYRILSLHGASISFQNRKPAGTGTRVVLVFPKN
ncbi:MAG: HAMP domain-containing histidine kinase [Cytophagaceae bacterium]|jgi:signal transduction histidine kinase|nr:HAMP domain-containing histidine kinase [Cytophagaceae bacterium]